MKQVIILFTVALSLPVYGQSTTTDGPQWIPPYRLIVPAGWSTERFLIPISFAPQIPYRGHEDVRFSPGWANAKSADYWSYLYVWWLEEAPNLTAATLQQNLTHYYSSLIAQNSKNKAPITLKNAPSTTVRLTETMIAGQKAYSGTIAMLDYMRDLPLTLNCLIRVIACPQQKQTAVIVEVSPQVMGHGIWDQFRTIEASFTCQKDR